jgi:hypothetical protein
MSSLPPALDFAKAEEEVCDKWAKESTFKTQDRLSEERGDEVSKPLLEWNGMELFGITLSSDPWMD